MGLGGECNRSFAARFTRQVVHANAALAKKCLSFWHACAISRRCIVRKMGARPTWDGHIYPLSLHMHTELFVGLIIGPARRRAFLRKFLFVCVVFAGAWSGFTGAALGQGSVAVASEQAATDRFEVSPGLAMILGIGLAGLALRKRRESV